MEMQDPNVNFYDVQESFNAFWEGRVVERGQGYKQFKRWEYFMEPRVFPTGKRPSPFANYLERLQFDAQFPTSESKSSNWTPLGPNAWTNPTGWNPGIGRVNCVAEDPTDPNIIYIGSPSGGIWKSTDSGISWVPLSDEFICMGISSIVISQSDPDIIYAATGDGDGNDTYSVGVVKSTDGGLTWNTTGLNYIVTESKKVYKLLIHPGNDQILWAATNNGFYKTEDGGDNWILKNNYSIRDIELNPHNPNTVFASGSSIFYSHDGGDSFTASSGLPAISAVGRMAITVTGADSNYLYAVAANNIDNGLLGIYQSTDGGSSFTLKHDTTNLLGYSEDGSSSGGQGWYDLAITCSHSNKNRILVGGVNVWRSVDGGGTFSIVSHWVHPSSVGYTHADIHSLDFIGPRLFCGSDGGIFRSFNSGTSWTDLSEGLEVGQFYKMGITEQNADLIIGGLQDNGTFIRKATGWEHIRGGDGMEAIIDPTNQDVWYTSYQNGSLNKSVDGGLSFFGISDSITEGGGWVTPYVINPNNTDILYAGYSSMWKTTDGGLDWEKVSTAGSTIRYIDISKSNSDYVYYSSYDEIWRTEDAGTTWINCTSNLPGGASISSFAISPNDPNVVFLTLSGYSNGEKVFVTNNAGTSWENLSGNLPNIPINCVAYEEGSYAGIYVGTDNGIYYKDSNLVNWQTYDDGLPNVIVNELNIHYASGTIRAATYGRGIWESPLKGPLTPPTAEFSSNFTTVCPGQDVQFTDECTNHGPFWEWHFPGGVPSSSTDQNPVVNYPNIGVYHVQLTATNDAGSDSIIKTNHITVEHATVFDLNITEDFESGWNNEWVVNNPDAAQSWHIVPYGSYGMSDSCIAIDNLNQISLSNDEFFSEAFDASTEAEVWLQFDYAYGRNSGYKKDTLAIYTTTNCGGATTHIWQLGGANLATVSGLFTGHFTPTPSSWAKVTIDISHVVGDSSVKVLFRNIGKQGNWLYLDNINITNYQPATALEEVEIAQIFVFPNPGKDIFNITGLPNGVVYEVYDLTGRLLIESDRNEINLGRYTSGIYLLKVNVKGHPQVVKISKE